jgi:hypothetical protein
MRPRELSIAIAHALEHKFPVLVEGSPGIGKSAIIEQCCKKAGADIVITHPVVSDPTDYKGLPFPTKKTLSNGSIIDAATFLPYGDLMKCIDANKPTVYFIDDLGQSPASVQAAIMQLVLARRINGHKVSDNVVFMAATNGRGDRAAVQGILEPVKSRFVILDLKPNIDDWVDWAVNTGNMPPMLIAFIEWRRTEGKNMLFDFNPTSDIVNSPSPRTVAMVGDIINSGCPQSVLHDMIKGAAGEAFAVEYIGFTRVSDALPNIEEICRSPLKASLPEEASLRYAVIASLSSVVSKKKIGEVYTYVKRMDKEYVLLFMRMASRINQSIEETETYDIFAGEFAEDIIGAAYA